MKKLNDKNKYSEKSKLKFKLDLENKMSQYDDHAQKLSAELKKVEEEWSTFNIEKKLEAEIAKEVERRMIEGNKKKENSSSMSMSMNLNLMAKLPLSASNYEQEKSSKHQQAMPIPM